MIQELGTARRLLLRVLGLNLVGTVLDVCGGGDDALAMGMTAGAPSPSPTPPLSSLPGRVIAGDPSNYLSKLSQLRPGDTLLLAPGRDGSAVRVQTHNGSVRDVRIFNNTVVAGGSGISVSGGAAGYAQRVSGNAVFAAGTAISVSGSHATASQNVTDTRDNASLYLNNPTAALGALDLYPRTTALQQGALDMSGLDAFPDWDHDFNCARRHSRSRGAYSGYENNAGWRVGLTVKPDCPLRARRDRTIRRH